MPIAYHAHMKAKSNFPAALAICIIGSLIGAALVTFGHSTNDFTGETTNNAGFSIGVIILAVSSLFGQYAICGFAARQALKEHQAAS